MRREEDEGARDESPIHFDPCGMSVVLQKILGDSAPGLAVPSGCWKRKYAAASGVNAWSFTPDESLRGRVVLVQTCKEGSIQKSRTDCWEGLELQSVGGNAKSLRTSCGTRNDV